jgi:hypothetical protein
MSHACRVRISFVVLVAAPILCTMSLSGPGLGQARAETSTQSGEPRPPAAHHHRHVKGTIIVCETEDVHSCHREFARRHGAQPR